MSPAFLTPELKAVRAQIEQTLNRRLDQAVGSFESFHSDSAALAGDLRAFVREGGKRIRPLLCYLGHAAAGGDVNPALLEICAALELFHAFALLHDDVMDETGFRRGQPSFPELAASSVAHRGDMPAGSFGRGMAILAGDLAFALAEEGFWSSGYSAESLESAAFHWNLMKLETAAGQYLDLKYYAGERVKGSFFFDPLMPRRIALLKTASYTAVGPLKIGASLAAASTELIEALGRYGQAIGEAFQISNDLHFLDGSGDDQDARLGRVTFVYSEALETPDSEVLVQLSALWGRPDLSQEELDFLRKTLRSAGVKDRLQAKMARLGQDAHQALDEASIVETAKSRLTSYADDIIRANKPQ